MILSIKILACFFVLFLCIPIALADDLGIDDVFKDSNSAPPELPEDIVEESDAGAVTGAAVGTDQINWWGTIAIVLIGAVGFLLVYIFTRPRHKHNSIVKDEEIKPKENLNSVEVSEDAAKINKRSKDVMETLDGRDYNVVSFLLDSNNKSTQSKIYHELRIPRTTLHRIVQSLQSKKIIEVEQYGKVNRIKLTDWFLGKDQ